MAEDAGGSRHDQAEALSNRPVEVKDPARVPDPFTPGEEGYKPRLEDWARLGLAYTFAGIFAATIAFACIAVLADRSIWTARKELPPIVVPAETAILGSAIGFYFGTKR